MEKKHWLDDKRNLRLLWRFFIGVLILTVAVEFFVGLHPHFNFESLFGFYAWHGFLSCAAMIVIAKGLGLILKRPDHYYENSL